MSSTITSNPPVAINGKDITELRIVPLQGFYDVLMKPAPMKKLVINENSAINGVVALSYPSMKKTGSSLPEIRRIQGKFLTKHISPENRTRGI